MQVGLVLDRVVEVEFHHPVEPAALAELLRVERQRRPVVPIAEAAGRPLELEGDVGVRLSADLLERRPDVGSRLGFELREFLRIDPDADLGDRFPGEPRVSGIPRPRPGLGPWDRPPGQEDKRR